MRPSIEIVRLEEFQEGTLGTLRVNKEVLAFTLELNDLLNMPNRSSIPAQQYVCQRIVSPKFGITFQVMSVPGRSSILIHPGNTVDDTAGCILLGESVGKLRMKRTLLNSGATYRKFMLLMEGIDEFILTIRECY